jgi:hypothetical protein
MKNKIYTFFNYYLLIFSIAGNANGRSIHRPLDPLMPELIVSWVGDENKYSLRNYHLEEYTFFKLFDKAHFDAHLLPQSKISYRYEPDKFLEYAVLTHLIENAIEEIKQRKKKLTHFTVLQDKDFNFKKSIGLIVLKCNEYPFVVKLFMETPQTFITPFDKGLEPIFFFFMAGGINRHESGFTRIKNMEMIYAKVQENPDWKDKIVMPRKWYWLPKNTRWLELVGHNMNGKKECKIQIPSVYCIIADFMEAERTFSLISATDKKIAMNLCNYLNLWIDPHITNFMIEKNSGKIVLVDTEHFPSFVGLKEEIAFNSYTEWYLYLAGKCFKNEFLLTKKERRNPKKSAPTMVIA